MKGEWLNLLSLQRLGKIYILPTRAGWGFILLLILLLLLSINFENNLAFAFTFLLIAIMIVAILHTVSNLTGITIDRSSAQSCFSGEEAGLTLYLTGMQDREHHQIQVGWVHSDVMSHVDLVEQSSVEVELSLPTTRRGWCVPPRVKLLTVYPLGLFKSWCYQSITARVLVYPAPLVSQSLPATSGTEGMGSLIEQAGSDDFSELKRFQVGMSPQHIAWKVFARGQGLHAKRFAARQDLDIWLDYDAWPEADQELRLSRLSYWVLKLHREDRSYGVRLPGKEWPPSKGERHRQQVLLGLALFGLESEQ